MGSDSGESSSGESNSIGNPNSLTSYDPTDPMGFDAAISNTIGSIGQTSAGLGADISGASPGGYGGASANVGNLSNNYGKGSSAAQAEANALTASLFGDIPSKDKSEQVTIQTINKDSEGKAQQGAWMNVHFDGPDDGWGDDNNSGSAAEGGGSDGQPAQILATTNTDRYSKKPETWTADKQKLILGGEGGTAKTDKSKAMAADLFEADRGSAYAHKLGKKDTLGKKDILGGKDYLGGNILGG